MVQHVLNVSGSGRTRTNARDKATLLTKGVSGLIGVKHHGGVEVRETNDEEHGEHPVKPTRAHGISKCVNPTHTREENRKLSREVQDGAREDDGDNASGVDLDRQVRRLPAHHAASDDALGVLHRDATLAALDVDDEGHNGDDKHHDHDGHQHAILRRAKRLHNRGR